MLRAARFTDAAADAVGWLAVLVSELAEAMTGVAELRWAEAFDVVIEAKIIWDSNVLWAAVDAIAAGCARNGDGLLNDRL